MKSLQGNKDGGGGGLGRKEQEKDREKKIWGERERNKTARENGVGKLRVLILTVGLNQQYLRMFAEGVNQVEQ